MVNKVRICAVFISKPKFEAGHPYVGFDNEKYKGSVLEGLRAKFESIDFVDEEVITKYDSDLMQEIKEDAKDCDGLFIHTVGQYGDPGIVDAGVELIQLNVPTVLANYPYGGDPTFLKIYDRVRGKGHRVLPISSPNFEDVEKAIDMLRRISIMRGKNILTYTLDEKVEVDLRGFMEFLEPDIEKPWVREMTEEMMKPEAEWSFRESYVDLVGTDQAHSWRRDEALYRRNLREVFGIGLLRHSPDEILESYRRVDADEARIITEQWKIGAKVINPNVTEKAIENAVKLYLASKELMERNGADAIAIDCGTLFLTGKVPAIPCFAFSRLMDDASTGICESDLDSGISALLVRYLFGLPSFLTNQSLDTVHNRATYMHCYAPTRMHGKDAEPLPYEIDTHGETEAPGLGAVPLVHFPPGETLTTIKISVLKKKIAIRTGRIVGMVRDEKACPACRVKALVETNAKRILENYDWDTFGLHRVSFLGDHRDEVIAAASLLGLEVCEEDQ